MQYCLICTLLLQEAGQRRVCTGMQAKLIVNVGYQNWRENLYRLILKRFLEVYINELLF